MNTQFDMVQFHKEQKQNHTFDFLSLEKIKQVQQFHNSFPAYQSTPLLEMKETAHALGLGNIFVKDESHRFGLNAFKVLGGSYAIGSYLAKCMGKDISDVSYDFLASKECRDALGGELTFVTATDGNHGRGVAWTAKVFHHKAVVYMPKGSSQERLNHILAEGADASITAFNYDDAVRLASTHAEENGWVMVQDTAWAGYEEIPRWIIAGYATIAYEIFQQRKERPTHIFLQAGVGSFAAAIAGFFSNVYQEECPIITIVEPNKANCLYKTAKENDGQIHIVDGDMDTIMAGLACGEPCSIGWEILKACVDNFISCPDSAAAQGMRILGNPPQGDTRIISGESGAAPFGCVSEIMRNPALFPLKEKLRLNEESKVLFISTEGDTDLASYQSIVWDGAYSR